MMHGSSGVSSTTEAWTHQFNAMGISTFVIDGFSGRGLTVVGPNQALLGRLNLIVDIYRSLEILAKHPRVDPDRIVLMGFSRGGQAALYASLDRFHKLWNKSGVKFAGYIPFYPDCSTTYADRHRGRRRPDPDLSRHARRLQSGRKLQGLSGAAAGRQARRDASPNIRTRRTASIPACSASTPRRCRRARRPRAIVI